MTWVSPLSFKPSIRKWPLSSRYFPGCSRSCATTGGSTIPTWPIDATIWAYFGVFFTDVGTILSGLMSERASCRLPASKPIATGVLCRGILCLRPCLNAVGQVLWKSIETLGPQQRDKILFGEQLSHGLG